MLGIMHARICAYTHAHEAEVSECKETDFVPCSSKSNLWPFLSTCRFLYLKAKFMFSVFLPFKA